MVDGQQIVTKTWLDATSRHDDIESAVRFNVARPQRGYKNFFWHHSKDGHMLRMAGNHAQNILIDKKSGTILVQTSVGYANGADEILFALFKSACEM
jgi:hypothetical protein